MDPVFLAGAGLLNIAENLYGRKRRRSEYASAKSEFDRTRANYQNLDTTNPYLNMENPYEDLTVNTQQARFTAQTQNQGMANAMDQLGQAAGGSGIASMAQAMAQQQAMNAQAASASIGQQEQQNAAAMAKGAYNIQSMERQGEVLSRDMQRRQASTELGMAQQEFGQARAERRAAEQQAFQALGQLYTGGANQYIGFTEKTGSAFGPMVSAFMGTDLPK